MNKTEINKNNYNTLLIRGQRNSSQEAINRNKYDSNSYKEKESSDKDNYIIGNSKKPKIDISYDMLQIKTFNKN